MYNSVFIDSDREVTVCLVDTEGSELTGRIASVGSIDITISSGKGYYLIPYSSVLFIYQERKRGE